MVERKQPEVGKSKEATPAQSAAAQVSVALQSLNVLRGIAREYTNHRRG